jgi:hypothetical protein
MQKFQCPICNSSAEFSPYNGGAGSSVVCPACGEFGISNIAKQEIEHWTQRQKANLSGWIREHQKYEILIASLEMLAALRTPTVGEKAEKILQYLVFKYPKPGEAIPLFDNSLPEINAVAWAFDDVERNFLIHSYLFGEKEFFSFVERKEEVMVGFTKTVQLYKISPKGWAYLDSLRQTNYQSQIGFIAMWFDESIKDAWIAIENGIRAAGYKPFRVDQKEHNNDITDEIIAGIRGSKFLVADLTRHRNGVYFEAGFAKGLGLEVVWLCRKSDEEDRHFDIRQLSCIFWEEDKLPELTKALTNRIVATIGRGPLQ